jgi:hypothetical protein
MHEVTITGVVRPVDFGGTSKSAHKALEIRTPAGSYVFKVIGENPFELSSKYQRLCGKTVRASGFLNDKTLMVRSFTVDDE